jgi:hypothetical protein
MKTTLLILMAVVMVGCASSSINLARISVGMSKTEVLNVMEKKPSKSSAIEGREYLWFYDAWAGDQYVEFTGGKVTGYGSWEDYRNPRKRKAIRLEIDQNIRKEIIRK